MKTTKRLLALVLSLVMAICCFSAAVPAFAATLEDNFRNVTLVDEEAGGTDFAEKKAYLNASSEYTGTNLKLTGMNNEWLQTNFGSKNNLMENTKGTIYYEFGGGETINNTYDHNYLFDLKMIEGSAEGTFLNNNFVGSDKLLTDHSGYSGSNTSIDRVNESGKNYDARLTFDLGSPSEIEAFLMFSHVRANTVIPTYKVSVSNDKDTLYDSKNDVVFYDFYSGLNAGKLFNGSAEGGCTTEHFAEGQTWYFDGESKPYGRYVGVTIYDAALMSGPLFLFELGIFGTSEFSVVKPTLKQGATTTESGLAWYAKRAKLTVGSDYKGSSVQVDNVYDSTLKTFGNNNIITNVNVKGSVSGEKNYSLANVTDGDIFDATTPNTADYYDGFTFPGRTSDSLYGPQRFGTDTYDATVTLTLSGETKIDTLYNFAHPGTNLSWCTYKIYVGNDLDTLYDDVNEVAYFDYYDGYKGGETYSLNGTHAAVAGDSTARRSDGQIWSFTDEKPVGTYVGYKVYYAEGTQNRLDIYDVGVFGTCYEPIETIHNDLIEIVPYGAPISLIEGATKQFTVNTYGDTEVTAVKMIKDGAEDVVLTADDNGVYTTPTLEEGMKIKVEASNDDTAPVKGVWNGRDLTKNSTTYDPHIWDDGVTYNESVMIYEGRTTVKLLYPIKEAVSVRSFDLQTAYYPGKDYVITDNGELQIPEGSSIKVYDDPTDFYNFVDSANGDYTVNWNSVSGWESVQWNYQIMVTYTHDKTWGDDALYETKPAGELGALSSFVKKATSGETTNVVFYGDSVGVGCSTTGLNEKSWAYVSGKNASELETTTVSKAYSFGLDANNLPDWVCETWPRAVTNALKETYGDNITYTNRSIGSTASDWCSEKENLDYLLGDADTETPCPVPDLLFIHYGLNEMGREKKNMKQNTEAIINYVRTLNPDCAVVLVSAFYPPQYSKDGKFTLNPQNLSQFEEAYYEIAAEYDNVIVAPVYSITESMCTIKSPVDYTHNLFNHPNDFGARVYASSIISILSNTPASNLTVEVAEQQIEYAGESVTPEVTVKLGNKTLKENENYTVAYSDNAAIGEATVTVTGINGTEGTTEKKFNIVHTQHKYDGCEDTTCEYCSETREGGHNWKVVVDKAATCTEAGVSHEACQNEGCTATQNENTPIPVTAHNWKVVVDKAATCTDAGVSHEACQNEGCTEKRNENTTIPALGHKNVTLAAVKATCTTAGKTAGTKCSVCGKVTKAQTTVKALGHKSNAGVVTKAATYDATGVKTYTCTVCKKVIKTETIAKKAKTSLKKATITVKDQTYSGKAKTPSITVKLNGKTLTKNTDYTVSYKNNKSIGKATVTIKGIKAYKDSASKTFKINPKKVTSLKLKSSKKKELTVSWKKDSKVSGYEIVYATNSKLTKGKKTVKVTSYKTYKKTIKKLTSKKTYYVKVRSYKTVSGKKYYSAYTSVKKLKIK